MYVTYSPFPLDFISFAACYPPPPFLSSISEHVTAAAVREYYNVLLTYIQR